MKAYLLTNDETSTKLAKTEKCFAQGKQDKFTVYKWFSSLSKMVEFNKINSVSFQECNEI